MLTHFRTAPQQSLIHLLNSYFRGSTHLAVRLYYLQLLHLTLYLLATFWPPAQMVLTAVKLVDTYCLQIIQQDQEDVNILTAAKMFSEQEQKAAGTKQSRRRPTMKQQEVATRRILFDTDLEKLTIGMKQFFSVFRCSY